MRQSGGKSTLGDPSYNYLESIQLVLASAEAARLWVPSRARFRHFLQAAEYVRSKSNQMYYLYTNPYFNWMNLSLWFLCERGAPSRTLVLFRTRFRRSLNLTSVPKCLMSQNRLTLLPMWSSAPIKTLRMWRTTSNFVDANLGIVVEPIWTVPVHIDLGWCS